MLEPALADRLVEIIASAVGREYPNKIGHVMHSDADARPPRELTPAFYGSFDWHSAVHGHWALVRLLRQPGAARYESLALAALEDNLTVEAIAGERRYLGGEGRAAFEMPYGIAWLLTLAAELHAWNHPRASVLAETLAPLATLARDRFATWLARLPVPIRTGEHNQSAFAMGLIIDAARATGDAELESIVRRRAVDFYGADVGGPVAYEPSAHDFLSPCLAEADLMRRVLSSADFARWLSGFWPGLASGVSLSPVTPVDRGDGKLVHFDGLNLSRAWMMRAIASALASDDRRATALQQAAEAHESAGLGWLDDASYAGSHWLGTFAVYVTTEG